MSVWTTANSGGLETPSKTPDSRQPPGRGSRNPNPIVTATTTQHHFQHVVAAAVAAATSVATGHQFPQQYPQQHHSNSPTGSGSNSNNSAGFKRSSLSNSLLQFPSNPPPPPPSSQNQAKAASFEN
ncbi:hypothetical protein KR059_004716 [Drosophila kikkawai]|nr:hypothetical protein KR059_004716 [Drosophila kikkawai]